MRFGRAQQQQSAVLTRLRLSRAHQLRRLLSLRHIAALETVDRGKSTAGGFLETTTYLSDTDAAVLMSFSNSAMFERLLAAVVSAHSGPPPSLERLLAAANPLLAFNYTMPTVDAIPTPSEGGEEPAMGVAQLTHFLVDEERGQWLKAAKPLERRRTRSPDSATIAAASRTADDDLLPAKRHKLPGTARTMATSGSLVARSREAWEAHLTEELGAEGETVESYRHSKTKSSYLDKAQFQQEAQWNEFLRERRLEEEQRERAAKQAVRRR